MIDNFAPKKVDIKKVMMKNIHLKNMKRIQYEAMLLGGKSIEEMIIFTPWLFCDENISSDNKTLEDNNKYDSLEEYYDNQDEYVNFTGY